jgi:hypothetical protein
MNVRAPWHEMKRLLLWAVAMLIAFTGAALLTGERDSGYVLLAASPFLLCLSAASLWMVWKRATAPKWDVTASPAAKAADHLGAECQPDQVPSDAIVANKADLRAAGGPFEDRAGLKVRVREEKQA